LTRLVLFTISLALLVGSSLGQDLPSKIRGYKLHKVKIHVTAGADEPTRDGEASIRLGEPRIAEAGLTGVVLETTAEVIGMPQTGEIDFLTFKDIVVNGIPVEAEDYLHPFSIKRGTTVRLPVPLRGSVNTLNVAKAGYTEFTSSRSQWRVTGTVFVFGRFKKFGMTFKRVIPIPIDLSIKNPMPALLGQ
jgi:hypothetical protein